MCCLKTWLHNTNCWRKYDDGINLKHGSATTHVIIITVGAESAPAEVTGEKDDFTDGTRRCPYNNIILLLLYTVAAAAGSR